MIHDPTIEVSCDGDNCHDSIYVEMPFTYPDYSGKGGRYDHRPSAIRSKIEREEWTIIGDDEDDAKTYCPECSERLESGEGAK